MCSYVALPLKAENFHVHQNKFLVTNLYCLLNPLQPGVAYLYPLKTSETFRFSGIFRGYR